MKVVWTANARNDLITIGDHIGRDNPARAGTFIDEIITCGDGIADRPGTYPVVPRFERLGIRRRLYRRYLIFYRITAESIEIVHVLHGAQDYARWLEMEWLDDA